MIYRVTLPGYFALHTADSALADAWKSARTLAFLDLIPANLFTAESVPLLVDLQMAHDTWMPHELGQSLQSWECSMEDIAIEHGLTYGLKAEA